MNFDSKSAAWPSDESWPRLWSQCFIAAAGLAGWLGISIGLRAIF